MPTVDKTHLIIYSQSEQVDLPARPLLQHLVYRGSLDRSTCVPATSVNDLTSAHKCFIKKTQIKLIRII